MNEILLRNIRKTFSGATAYILLAALSVIMLLPFAWLLSSSFKDNGSMFVIPPEWIPKVFHFENYAYVLTETIFIQGFINTLMIIIPPIFVGVFSSSMAAFGFSRIQFPFRDKLFFAMLATMMIPGIVTLIPSFILLTKVFGWADSWNPLIIPGMFGAVTTMFFLRQFFLTIPKEMEEAAEIDGMNKFMIFIKIFLPLSKPAIVTQLILSLNGAYNDYLGPYLYINTPEKGTLQIVLASFKGMYSTEWGFLMAGSTLALIPTVLMFVFAQKFFVEGITLTGMKA